MASLNDARALADDLRRRVDAIGTAFDGNVDFRRIVQLADDLGQASDRLAVTFNAIDTAFASHGSRTQAATAEEREAVEDELTAALAPSRSRGRRSQKAETASQEAGSDGSAESAEREEQEAEATATRSKA